jgi:hypothetical protein
MRGDIDFFETASEAEAFWADQLRTAVENNDDAQVSIRQIKREARRRFVASHGDETKGEA